jgi:hypothetical protein
MNRLTMLAFAIVPALTLAAAMPAAAQEKEGPADNPSEKVNQLIVYGDDECPKSEGNEITVCARKPESERYRIPENLRTDSSPENTAWTQKVESYETVGNFGTLSCSPSGYGGWSGCTQALIKAAYQEKKTNENVRFSELIAKERAKRLSKIDEEAAEEQARVEELEKEYDAKQKADGGKPDAGTAGDDATGDDSGAPDTGE